MVVRKYVVLSQLAELSWVRFSRGQVIRVMLQFDCTKCVQISRVLEEDVRAKFNASQHFSGYPSIKHGFYIMRQSVKC